MSGVKFKYKAGQVVWCKFPREENPSIIDDRPALILSTFEVQGVAHYRCAKMTKTDNSGKFAGKWISMKSKEGIAMNLDYDTFIHLERILQLKENAIRKLKSANCPVFEELKKYCKEKKINM